jgi:hypothetical protein
MVKHVRIELSGKDGIFRTEKNLSLFVGHTTTMELKDNLTAIKKEIVKFLTSGDCTITLLSMDKNYHSQDEWRFIPASYAWQGTFELSAREFNGYDYSNSVKYNFTSQKELLKYLMNHISKFVNETMGNLPEEYSWYSQKSNEIEIPEEILEFIG